MKQLLLDYQSSSSQFRSGISIEGLRTTEVFDEYWRFACERQSIFFARIKSDIFPWTSDPILLNYKFTNAYRASDRVSQYLIRNVIYSSEYSAEDTFFRIILFKIFNKIETWELIEKKFGEITYKEFSFKLCEDLLTDAMQKGERIYSAAYIMPSGGRQKETKYKHQMHLDLLKRMMIDGLSAKIFECEKMADAFDLLLLYPTIGEFLAYQYVTDLNYSKYGRFSESEFVCAGPGAKDGISKCFHGYESRSFSDIIKIVFDGQNSQFDRLGLSFQNLWGRDLQLIDCQNLFCEISKYSRVSHPEIAGISGRTKIKQRYSNVAGSVPQPFYPPKWGLKVS